MKISMFPITGAFLLAALSAQSVSLVWDGNGATTPNPNGGTGTWDTNTTANWWDGAANVNWPALGGTDDDAVFGNTAGTVTINGGVTANSLTFNTTGYTLTGATSTFNGAAPTITNGTGIIATINAPIAGTVTKTGDGELNLATLNAGATLILNAGTTRANTGGGIKGTLQINTGAVFRNTQAHVFDTATARIWVNGGTLTHGPATFPEYYVPHGASAADPGVQMTGGLREWANRFQLRRDRVSAFQRRDHHRDFCRADAQLPGRHAGLQRGGRNGSQRRGPAGHREPRENFGGGTTHITKTGAGLMEISGTATLNGPGLFTLAQGTLRLTGATGVTNFGGTGVALDAANAAVLQLNAVNAADSLTFSKAISGGSAAAAVEKTGAGTVTLTNAKTYSAPTRVLVGTLAVTGTLGNTGVTVSNGATLAGEGSIGATGSLTFQDGARLRIDGSTAGALTVGGGGTGNLTLNGTTIVDVTGVSAPLNGTSTFRVLNYGGTLTGGAANLGLANPLSEYRNASFSTAVAGQVDLAFGTYDLTWSGAAGSAWDHGGGANWNNSPDGRYYRGDSVLFGDGPSNRAVNLAAAVAPYSVTFTATAGNDYEWSGAGGVTGSTGLVKNGTGKATLATVNTYTGATMINAGTLQLGNAA
ncbi:MAG: autotransporter-associated beta strand repeat-containing protein, partial [Kiritimatiellia bacterium]